MSRLYVQSGLSVLGIILLLAVGIVVLGYFNVSIKDVLQKPTVVENTNFVKNSVENLWQKYLSTPVLYIWNNIFSDLLWGSFVENMKQIKNEQPTWYEQNAPQVNTNVLVNPTPTINSMPQFYNFNK